MAEERVKLGPRLAGLWDEEAKSYRIMRRFSIHYARRFCGYGIQASIMRELERRGCVDIILDEERASGSVWRMRIPFERWAKGPRAVLRAQDGEQVFLSESAFPKGERIKQA